MLKKNLILLIALILIVLSFTGCKIENSEDFSSDLSANTTTDFTSAETTTETTFTTDFIANNDYSEISKTEMFIGHSETATLISENNTKRITNPASTTIFTAPTTSLNSEIKVDEEKIYEEYIDSKFDIIPFEGNLMGKTYTDSVFCILVRDFDADDEKEMVAFSFVDTYDMIIRLYNIQNGKVVLCDESEAIPFDGTGNFDCNACAEYKDSKIILKVDRCSFGGSMCHSNYNIYKIKNDKLVLEKEFELYEFYRYDELNYDEYVSGKTYENVEEFNKAVENAGIEQHVHTDLVFEEGPDTTYSGDDIFIYLYSYNFSGNYRIVLNNGDKFYM